MAPEIGCFTRDRDDVSGAGGDVAVAPGAQVVLGGLIGLHATNIDLESHRIAFGGVGHRVGPGSTEERPDHEASTHHEGGTDHHEVERRTTMLAMRIESHSASIAGGGRDRIHRHHD